MRGFTGFGQKGRMVRLPGVFFSELLPDIDHLGELKTVLYIFWRLQKTEDRFYIQKKEILSDNIFMSGLGHREDESRKILQDSLERAVARGILLHVTIKHEKKTDEIYFVNTPRGRSAVEGIESGEWNPITKPGVPFDLTIERPNIFVLYEQNIGPLTPLIADQLRDLEERFQTERIIEAIHIAVRRNARNLKYIEAILNRWKEEGKGEDYPSNQVDSNRFVSGKYQDEIET